MRKRVLTFIAACLYYTGIVKLALWSAQRSGQRLIILNYHRATGGDLHRQMLYLHRHYRILHLEEALEELYTPHKEKQVADRRMPLVLTFDDGYHDNYTHGFALACELQVPITIFLIPGYIESGDYFWWLEGQRLARRSKMSEVTIEGRTYYLGSSSEQRALAQAIDTRLRHARSVAEREAFLATVRMAFVTPSNVTVEEEAVLPLTWEEVHKMEEGGWVSFGAHTMHHPVLAYLADPAETHREVAECRAVLEQRLGHAVRTFAYPVGKSEHIGEIALRSVRDAGYDWAVTTIYGTNTSQSDPLQLRRVAGLVSRHWLVMAAETSGIWKFFSHLWKNPVLSWMERD